MKEFLYGKLNKEVEQVLYKGADTDTAKVNIDNTDYTISVDVHKYSSPTENMVVGYSDSGTLKSNDPENDLDVVNNKTFLSRISAITTSLENILNRLLEIESALTMKGDSGLIDAGANTDPNYGEIIEGERQG